MWSMDQKLKEGFNKDTNEVMITLPKTALIIYPNELWDYVPCWLLAKWIKRGKRYKRYLQKISREKVASSTKGVV